MSTAKDVARSFAAAVLGLAVLAALLLGAFGVVGYIVADGPLWGFVAGVAALIAFMTFWVYMRTHHWE